jgi:hypothetical protein
MEAPAAPAHAPKKRKFDRMDGQESPGSSSAGHGVSLDFINNLPDAVLCTIISLLRTKDGARTQAVSRRWRPLWRSAPLNLVADSTLSGQERKRVVYVSKILAEHPGPALRFALPYIRQRYCGKIECWLRSQALTNLQELDFGYDVEGYLPSSLPLPLPPSTLRFAPTLHVARFSSCRFPAQSLNFPHLKQLTLYGVTFPGDALAAFPWKAFCCKIVLALASSALAPRLLGASASPLLSRAKMLPISKSWSLRMLPALRDCYHFIQTGPRTIQVIRAPKLQVLGLLSDGISKLHIGTTVFQVTTAF